MELKNVSTCLFCFLLLSTQGRITVCNLASVGSTNGPTSVDQAQRKLYIGGLSYDTTSDTLLNIFSQYGEIEEGAIAYDKNTNKSRFGLVS